MKGEPEKPIRGTRLLEGLADRRHGVHDVAELLVGFRHVELGNGLLALNGMVEHGTLAGHEVQAEAHGIGNRQNVGKKDGRVETVTVDRLQRHFRSVIGVHGEAHETARARTGFAILRQIAAGLTHQPHGGKIGFFTLERTQKAIVDRFHGSHLETEEIQKS